MWAVVVSSGRLVRVTRTGRLLIIHRAGPPMPHFGYPVSTCRYDHRFHLLPAAFVRRR